MGWAGVAPTVTIDLERSTPIAGLSFSTAAGRAGVTFPSAIFVLVSDDDARWHAVGDLVALSEKGGHPPASGYAEHRYRTMDLHTRGDDTSSS